MPLLCPSSAPTSWFPYFLWNSFFVWRSWSLLVEVIKSRLPKLDYRLTFIQITTFIEEILCLCLHLWSINGFLMLLYFFSVWNVHFDILCVFFILLNQGLCPKIKEYIWTFIFLPWSSSNTITLKSLAAKNLDIYLHPFLVFKVSTLLFWHFDNHPTPLNLFKNFVEVYLTTLPY